ncbi:unnamed protein product [Rangifer tarandus platyrhynchus]|uniref:Uncharacterized protein n=1 Tax=Rangifer tarandus platyrhynchus TaxID=3082113 RepID=A0ABN8ZEK2_RANTA|nr:unnamed protein product [Rangifer tarandus platyrhynchus]
MARVSTLLPEVPAPHGAFPGQQATHRCGALLAFIPGSPFPDIETKPAQALRLSTPQDSGTKPAYAQGKGTDERRQASFQNLPLALPARGLQTLGCVDLRCQTAAGLGGVSGAKEPGTSRNVHTRDAARRQAVGSEPKLLRGGRGAVGVCGELERTPGLLSSSGETELRAQAPLLLPLTQGLSDSLTRQMLDKRPPVRAPGTAQSGKTEVGKQGLTSQSVPDVELCPRMWNSIPGCGNLQLKLGKAWVPWWASGQDVPF